MARDVPTAFVQSKNSELSEPRWLYTIAVDDVPTLLYITNGPEDIVFDGTTYKGQPAGDAPGGPIYHDGLAENINGTMDAVSLSVGNCDQLMQAWLESTDGLRGKAVTIRMVFNDNLSDATAKIDWNFTINASAATTPMVVFDLVWRNDPLRRMVPTQLFDRETFPSAPNPNEVIL